MESRNFDRKGTQRNAKRSKKGGGDVFSTVGNVSFKHIDAVGKRATPWVYNAKKKLSSAESAFHMNESITRAMMDLYKPRPPQRDNEAGFQPA